MRLGDLVPIELQPLLSDAERAIDITGLTADSRKVARGFLFAALAGTKLDGTDFIPEAVARGAAAVLAREPRPPRGRPEGGAVFLQDRNPRHAFALMAARFFGAQPDTIVAVTGTNGKTSVVDLHAPDLAAARAQGSERRHPRRAIGGVDAASSA